MIRRTRSCILIRVMDDESNQDDGKVERLGPEQNETPPCSSLYLPRSGHLTNNFYLPSCFRHLASGLVPPFIKDPRPQCLTSGSLASVSSVHRVLNGTCREA